MKKVIAFILLIYFPLFSQNSITFPDYIEDLQNKSPKKYYRVV
nr:hypothetical protein [Brachyspira hampsonii]